MCLWTVDAIFSNCPHVLAILKYSELQAGSERRGWLPAKTLRCLRRRAPYARLPRIALNALSGFGVVSCFPLYSSGRPLGLPTTPTIEVGAIIFRWKTLRASDPPNCRGGRPLGHPTLQLSR
ncbi:hypothetical protein PanWU01x14_145230 [Parasponia andersonii]|uniref:Uncharacterized protein n=1 Tax=Parasponia andersonii TaxID=3476 RepID=A0A2P5CKM0_PARAD|nr:hypothetical protein PanWU01x14_145230 [Parasponia andersonii]